MKKSKIILILVTFALFIVVIFVLFNYVKLSSKFKLCISRQAEIVYEYEHTEKEDFYYYQVALKVSEKQYQKILGKIERKDFLKCDMSDSYTQSILQTSTDWVTRDDIIEVYEYFATENHNIVGTKRLHITVFVTESIDGFRTLYLERN